MTWPEAFVRVGGYLCLTFLVWRAGAGIYRGLLGG